MKNNAKIYEKHSCVCVYVCVCADEIIISIINISDGCMPLGLTLINIYPYIHLHIPSTHTHIRRTTHLYILTCTYTCTYTCMYTYRDK